MSAASMYQRRDLLQIESQVRRDGDFRRPAAKGARGREQQAEEAVGRGDAGQRDVAGGGRPKIELGKGDLGIGVDHGLLMDPTHPLQGADIEGILGAAITGAFALEFAMRFLVGLPLGRAARRRTITRFASPKFSRARSREDMGDSARPRRRRRWVGREGAARREKLSPERRAEIARKAAEKR
jgi:hypothetical protein